MTLNDVQNYARSTSKLWLTSWKEQTKVYLRFVANLFNIDCEGNLLCNLPKILKKILDIDLPILVTRLPILIHFQICTGTINPFSIQGNPHFLHV